MSKKQIITLTSSIAVTAILSSLLTIYVQKGSNAQSVQQTNLLPSSYEKNETNWQGLDRKNYLDDVIKTATSNLENAGSATLISEGNYRYCITYANPKIVSYCFQEETYTGGAHGNHTIDVGTIDLLTGKKLSLADILTPEDQKNLTKQLQDMVKERIEADKDSGFIELPELTENFCYDGSNLHFIYREYEIACYAAGTIDLCVKWELKDYKSAESVSPYPLCNDAGQKVGPGICSPICAKEQWEQVTLN